MKRLALICLLFIGFGCSTLKEVQFKTPVDTTTKKIDNQKKTIFSIDDIGVYASNEFDGARLNGFEKVNDSTVKAIIKPENTPINNSAYYSFKIWSKKEKTIYIQFDYPEGFKHRYIPKIKTVSTPWKQMNDKNIIRENNFVTVKLDVVRDTTWVSAQELMTSKDTRKWYNNLIVDKTNYVHLKSVGKSRLGKDLPVLDIYKGKKEQKPIVVLLTRQHPPEVTGFFAFQEFLTTILKENNLTTAFLNKYRVLAFPIVNPDGVDLGHWRHNAGGVDTNRDWSKYNQPEIKQIIKFITKASKKDKAKIILGLDFHSTYEDVFYTNKIREKTTLPNFIEEWFTALEENIPNYKVNEKAGNSTKPVSKGWFLYGQNALGITYEIGDATPRNKIKLVGKVTAEEMMKILIKTNSN
ncbi:MAG: M14 family metallopeptidase [Polaribacter sp.]|uniref:M14 family metallopeptidase n=1 Tax=Polaribacter sp. TaxID=1920175 RepID=UPI002F35F0EB